jgi:RNA polymerase sigma-70 factor (ECF subfamily)
MESGEPGAWDYKPEKQVKRQMSKGRSQKCFGFETVRLGMNLVSQRTNPIAAALLPFDFCLLPFDLLFRSATLSRLQINVRGMGLAPSVSAGAPRRVPKFNVVEWCENLEGFRMSGPGEVTRLLGQLRAGRKGAAEQLTPLIYQELHKLAAACMRRERPGHTLQATALVNEAYMRLLGQHDVEWQNRSHFYGIAAQIMRRILLDYARKHQAAKRGGPHQKVRIDEALLVSEQQLDVVLAVDESLKRLEQIDPRQSRVVELRFFAGLDVEQTAAVLGISTATVKREWQFAKAWLQREMGETPA